MKTEPMRRLATPGDDLLLTEEVLLSVRNEPHARRVLLAFALVFIANALRAGVGFELRKLDSRPLAVFDGKQLQSRVEIEAALPSISAFLDRFSEELTQELMKKFGIPH